MPFSFIFYNSIAELPIVRHLAPWTKGPTPHCLEQNVAERAVGRT